MIDLKEAFERAESSEPTPATARDHLAAGQLLVRRRRARVSIGAASIAVAGGVALSAIGMPGNSDHERTGPDTSRWDTAERRDRSPREQGLTPADVVPNLPVLADPQPDAQPIEVDFDTGTFYRLNKRVRVLKYDESTPVLNGVSGKRIGKVVAVQYRYLAKTGVITTDIASNRVLSSMSDTTSWRVTMNRLQRMPIYFSPPDGSTFVLPFGVDRTGGIDPKFSARVVQEAEAGVFSTRIFDGAAPTFGEVRFHGRRYYAIVGYQSDLKDVIIGELPAPGQTLDEWLIDVKRRMDAGEDLQIGY